MVSTTSVKLRRPNKKGFLAPSVVLELIEAVEELLGPEARDELLEEAQLFRLPNPDEPVREEKAARLHQTVRANWPEHAQQISRAAGSQTADWLIEGMITSRARSMLSRMPRATGAWLLAKTARQHAWTFSGSGELVVESAQRFILRGNPLVLGETSDHPVCHFHASLFERLFSALIHPRLTCREVSCMAKGGKACVFEFSISPAASA